MDERISFEEFVRLIVGKPVPAWQAQLVEALVEYHRRQKESKQ